MARILVIDDDAAVRDALTFVLRAYGFDVVGVDEGMKGIAALDEGSIDLLIVDRYMPRMDGLEVIKSVRAKRPKLPIIAMSGSIDENFVASSDLPTGADFGPIKSLPKPLKADRLISLVKQLLSADGGAH
jgi:DNA-binding response OmpR family regulator